MRMTQRKKQTPQEPKPKKKANSWGSEEKPGPDPSYLDADGNPPDVHDGGTHAMPQKPQPDPDVVARRASDQVRIYFRRPFVLFP